MPAVEDQQGRGRRMTDLLAEDSMSGRRFQPRRRRPAFCSGCTDASSPIAAGDDTLVVGGRTITQQRVVDAPGIARVIADSLKRGSGRPAVQAGDRARTREALIGTVRMAVRAIEMKSPAEAEPFKAWLASLAAKVCHAANAGSECPQITRDRQDTIDRLAGVLAVTPVSQHPAPRAHHRSPATGT
jgi:hypothetical protein